jgi:hypothetical protein
MSNENWIDPFVIRAAKLGALPDVLRAKLDALPIISSRKERSAVELTTDEKIVIAQFGKVSVESFATTKTNGVFLGPARRDEDEDDAETWVTRARNHLAMLGEPNDEAAPHERMEEASKCLTKAAALARAKLAKQLHSSRMVRFANA